MKGNLVIRSRLYLQQGKYNFFENHLFNSNNKTQKFKPKREIKSKMYNNEQIL